VCCVGLTVVTEEEKRKSHSFIHSFFWPSLIHRHHLVSRAAVSREEKLTDLGDVGIKGQSQALVQRVVAHDLAFLRTKYNAAAATPQIRGEAE